MLKAMLAQTLAAILGWGRSSKGMEWGSRCRSGAWELKHLYRYNVGAAVKEPGGRWQQIPVHILWKPIIIFYLPTICLLGKLNGNLCGRKTISLGKFSSFLHGSVFVFAAEKILPSLLRCISNNRIK